MQQLVMLRSTKMDERELNFILQEGEGYKIEFKENLDKSLAKEIVAFANSSGGRIFPKANFGKISVRRNELISDLFSRMDKCERAGSGIQRMRDEMLNAGLNEPKFEGTSFFRAIFYRPGKVGETTQITPQITPQKTVEKTVEKILELITENPSITVNALAEKLGLSRRGLEWNISNLKQKGLLKRIGPDKGGYWKIVKK